MCLTQVISDYSALTRDETVMSPWTKVAPVGGEHNSNVTPTAETQLIAAAVRLINRSEDESLLLPSVNAKSSADV